MSAVDLVQLRVRIGRQTIVDGVSLTIEKESTLGLVGPNGSGKSTLLRSIYRGLPATGAVLVDGAGDILTMRRSRVAELVAATVQESPDGTGMSVREVVELGRLPRSRAFGRPTAQDREAVLRAARLARVEPLLDRELATLSGGERQRVHLARAFAQETPILLLDEPTNHLDIAHQLMVLEMTRSSPATAIVAVHDLALAAHWCEVVAVLSRGKLVAVGPPTEILDADLLASVFGVTGQWISLPSGPRLVIDPLPPPPG